MRTGCKSQSISQYFQNYLSNNNLATTEIIDLKAFDFSILKGLKNTDEIIYQQIISRLKEEGFGLSKLKLTKKNRGVCKI